METYLYDFQIRVLVYQDDGEFVAHALEFDLLGFGKTEKQAVEDLHDAVSAQLSFAVQQNDDSLMNCSAPKEFFDRWEEAHTAQLKKRIFPDRAGHMEAKASFIKFDKSDFKKKRFELAGATSLA